MGYIKHSASVIVVPKEKLASDGVSVDFGGDDDILRMQTAERRWFDGKEWKYE